MGEDAPAAPDAGAGESADAGSVPAVLSFQGAPADREGMKAVAGMVSDAFDDVTAQRTAQKIAAVDVP